MSLGLSALPLKWAGQASWQRPQRVQASKSSSCFQVKSSILATPKSSVASKSTALSAPLGRSERKKTLRGENKMCCNRERASQM